MWQSIDEEDVEVGYKVCIDHIEKRSEHLLFDDDGNQCYLVYSNGYDFSVTGEPDTFVITPCQLAKMIQDHDGYRQSPVRLLSSCAGSYEKGAACELAFYLRQPVIAPVQSVYIDAENEKLLSSPVGHTDDDIEIMMNKRHAMTSEKYQANEWQTFKPDKQSHC